MLIHPTLDLLHQLGLAGMPPFRTVLGFQACHLDSEFYERFYRAEALSESERAHMDKWHGGARA